jgi:steroid delta-isomerase-like uncharacterized protein
MTSNDRTVAHRIVEEMWNAGDLDVAEELFAKDYVNHVLGYPKPLVGPEGFRQLVSEQRRAFPDMRESIDDLVTEGERIVMRWSVVGTHRGECMGVAPTGRRVTFSGITIFRLGSNGKVEEEWCYWDFAALMFQLGFTFEPARAPASAVG